MPPLHSRKGKRRKKTKEKIEKGEAEADERTWTHAEGGEGKEGES